LVLTWEKKRIPIDWKDSIICPIYKKGDRMQCKNYRPITLMNVAYKIFTTILSNRLSQIMESKLGEYQAGFRPNRSTVDNIFILRQMYEKCYEHNMNCTMPL
jgi:sorting nexin-29